MSIHATKEAVERLEKAHTEHLSATEYEHDCQAVARSGDDLATEVGYALEELRSAREPSAAEVALDTLHGQEQVLQLWKGHVAERDQVITELQEEVNGLEGQLQLVQAQRKGLYDLCGKHEDEIEKLEKEARIMVSTLGTTIRERDDLKEALIHHAPKWAKEMK